MTGTVVEAVSDMEAPSDSEVAVKPAEARQLSVAQQGELLWAVVTRGDPNAAQMEALSGGSERDPVT
jgi:hypothetical protein